MQLQQDILKSSRPYLIAGPCSAESEEQVLTICTQLKDTGKVKMLRAGIWKPRTRPDSFEGIGAIGLPWLVEAGKKTGLPVCTEVANAKHVELALKAGVDVLWIGARTTVNPFAVQEIADAVAGTKTPVMIKNPVNPDLSLWIGAFERLQKVGIEDLVAIHRGFSIYKHKKYRNVPSWEIPLGFKEQMPHIPMINDPSHITGRRDLLLEVAQKAMDLNFDGLIIETHPNPDKAWSDKEQQITAEVYSQLIDSLILRKSDSTSIDQVSLDRLRTDIGMIDEKIFELLSERMLISEEIGNYKREHNITIFQEEHWKKVKKARLNKSEEMNLSTAFIQNILDNMHQESIRHQTKIMNTKK